MREETEKQLNVRFVNKGKMEDHSMTTVLSWNVPSLITISDIWIY